MTHTSLGRPTRPQPSDPAHHTHTHIHTHSCVLEASRISGTIYSRNADCTWSSFTSTSTISQVSAALLEAAAPAPWLQRQGWTWVSGVLSTMMRFLISGPSAKAVLMWVQMGAWSGGLDQLKQVRTALRGTNHKLGSQHRRWEHTGAWGARPVAPLGETACPCVHHAGPPTLAG